MKLQVNPRFPLRVVGANGVTVTRANGIITISGTGHATPRIITVAGDVIVDVLDEVIAFNQAVPQAVNILLPPASTRNYLDLSIEDLAGVAGTYPKTAIRAGADLIDGLTNFVLGNDYGFLRLRPYPGIGWKVISP